MSRPEPSPKNLAPSPTITPDPPRKSSPTPPVVDTFSAFPEPHTPSPRRRNRRRDSWTEETTRKRRPHSPALPWHREYSQLDPRCGRVLVIDYLRADESHNRKRKVVAQEVDCLAGLRKLYKHKRHGQDGNLRLLHVQNAPWATRFLLRKFNIDGRDELVGSNFGRYARHTKPERRGGKPFPNAKSWRVQHDPWRGIAKTSFGFDYLKEYESQDSSVQGRVFDEKMMELNGYDDEDNPVYGSDVYIQRLACYIQHKEDGPSPPVDGQNGVVNPYQVQRKEYAEGKSHRRYLPRLDSLDNEDAIIIFDNSKSGSFEDCLLPARSEWEVNWRRLPFYLAFESRELVGNDELLGRQCARRILDDVFRASIARWETLLDACHVHVSILEDKIYEQPADETRAPELWKNSSLWLQLEKLTTAHTAIVQEMRVHLRDLISDVPVPSVGGGVPGISRNNNNNNNNSGSDTASAPAAIGGISHLAHDEDWLEQIPTGFDRVATTVDEDLVKPTQALISLLYQSVSIRDSRLSLQIDTSMWRLSWITFIFLPLTFMVGFFGMNVDTFSGDPSIKWYFIVSVPFMVLVLGGWYIMKHILARQRQTPYQRGTYETFFHTLALNYPKLWTRLGPRDYIVPRSRLDKWRWWLIQRWTRPERTIKAGQANADTAAPSSLSRWSKIKMALIRHWSGNLRTFGSSADEELLDGDDESDTETGSAGASALVEGLFGATELLTVPGQPMASAAVERLEERRQHEQLQPAGSEQQQQQHHHHHQQHRSDESLGVGNVVDADRADERPSRRRQQRSPSPGPVADSGDGPVRVWSPEGRPSERPSPPGDQRNASTNTRKRRGRPTSSGAGSSGSRNSSVLVEEEDPKWIRKLAEEGKGWYWRPSSTSPAGWRGSNEEGGSPRRRRLSDVSLGGQAMHTIDERFRHAAPSLGLRPDHSPSSVQSLPPAVNMDKAKRSSLPSERSPLGTSVTRGDDGSDDDGVEPVEDPHGNGPASSPTTVDSATQTASDPDLDADESPDVDDGTSTPVPHAADTFPPHPHPSAGLWSEEAGQDGASDGRHDAHHHGHHDHQFFHHHGRDGEAPSTSPSPPQADPGPQPRRLTESPSNSNSATSSSNDEATRAAEETPGRSV